MIEPKKWVDISLGILGLVAFLVFWQVLADVWDYFSWPTYDDFGVGLPAVAAAVGGIFVFFVLRRSVRVTTFLSEVVSEMSKVTWPVRKETLLSSVVVLIMVAVASLFLFLFDSLWGTLSHKMLTL